MASLLFVFVVAIISSLLLAIPPYIAYKRKHPQFIPILILDIFLGWSGIVWVLLIAWSLWSYNTPNKHTF